MRPNISENKCNQKIEVTHVRKSGWFCLEESHSYDILVSNIITFPLFYIQMKSVLCHMWSHPHHAELPLLSLEVTQSSYGLESQGEKYLNLGRSAKVMESQGIFF